MGKGKLIHSRREWVSIQPPRQKWRVWSQKAGLGLWFTRTFAEPLTGAGDSEETEQRGQGLLAHSACGMEGRARGLDKSREGCRSGQAMEAKLNCMALSQIVQLLRYAVVGLCGRRLLPPSLGRSRLRICGIELLSVQSVGREETGMLGGANPIRALPLGLGSLDLWVVQVGWSGVREVAEMGDEGVHRC